MIENNPQYQELKVKPGVFVPDIGVEYPTDATVRMFKAVKTREFAIDETYPYYENTFSARLQRFLAYIICRTYVFTVQHLVYGFRAEGRENLKKYKKLFKEKGCITTCNHAYKFDMVSVIQATGHKFFIPMHGENMKTRDYWYMKNIGGIPIPSGIQALKKYNEAFDKRHAEGTWIHLFPEGLSWPFYKPLKPFHKGAFTMAYKWDCPVLPCYLTYRPRTGIHKLFGKAEIPLITCHIGTPVLPDMSLPRGKAVEKLTQEVWDQMLELGGIEHNPWPTFA